jgi:hypothetical protein
MKRFIKATPVIFITFIIGVLAFMIWARLYTRRISLCEIARNPARYNGRLVRIETFGSVLSSRLIEENSVFIYERACSDTGLGTNAGVWLDPDFELSREADEFVNSRTPEIREAKVVVEGLFDQWATMGCFTPQFGIKDATLTLESPVTTLESPVTSQPLPQMPTPD